MAKPSSENGEDQRSGEEQPPPHNRRRPRPSVLPDDLNNLLLPAELPRIRPEEDHFISDLPVDIDSSDDGGDEDYGNDGAHL